VNGKSLLAQNHINIQELAYSCGPVALLNILRMKENFSYSELELSEICKAKAGIGTSHKNLVIASKKIGLEVLEEKAGATLSDIERNLDAGAFVIINYYNAYSGNGHYTVATDYDEKAFYTRDSAFGLFRLRKEHLQKCWYDTHGESSEWYMAVR
jgi:hypothetical protein